MTGPRYPGMILPDEYDYQQPQQPVAAPQMQAPPRAGWAARLFGGADPLQQGLISVEQANALGRQGLFNTGLNLLANSGPAPYQRGLGELLAGGIQSGQQAYQQGATQALGQEGVLAQRQAQRRLEMIRQRYQGRNDPQSLTAFMHDLIGEGTPEALAGARSISEYLKSLQNDLPALQYQHGLQGATGPVTRGFDRSGRQVGPDMPEAQQPSATAELSRDRLNSRNAERWEARFYNPQRKAVEAYHLFQSHLAEAATGNEAATKSLISAFAANADPFNQLRLGMLNYLSEVNPSAAGKLRIAFQKASEGTLPPEDVRNLARIVQSNFEEIRNRVTRNYRSYVARNPGLESYFTATPEDFFGVDTPSAGTNVNPITGKPRGQ